MTVIIKEKALFIYTGRQWLNIANAKSIAPEGDRVVVCWIDGKIQGFDHKESQVILKVLKEIHK